MGAEVIKVEWPQNLDPFRQNRANAPPGVEPGPNSSGTFADTNANKVSVTMNMRSERGMELLRELISISDVVIENFSSRVMRRRGLATTNSESCGPTSYTSRWPDSGRKAATTPIPRWGRRRRRSLA